MILSEPFAYLLATTAFYLVTRASHTAASASAGRWWLAAIGVAHVASEAPGTAGRYSCRVPVHDWRAPAPIRPACDGVGSLAAAGWISFGVLVIYAYRSPRGKRTSSSARRSMNERALRR
jgi:hypothetical protein